MAARATTRSLARLGWTAALVGLAVLVLASSAPAKGPPSGKGGPPPWAGGGGKSGGGPPAWAGGGKSAQKAKGGAKKAQKGLEKAAKKAARARKNGELNPAMTCFGLLGELGEEFYETYGTNPNKANAFGKCVSEHARKQGEDDEEAPEDEPEEPAECEEPAEGDEPAEGEDPLAALASFDEDPPAGDGCEPAEEETGDSGDGIDDPEDADDDDGDESEPKLTCFLPATAARANPFAVCVRA